MKTLVDRAIISYGNEKNIKNIVNEYKKIDEIPFDFSRRRLSVVVTDGEKKQLITKGAVEEILDICTLVDYKGQISEITKEIKHDFELLKRGRFSF